MDVFENRCVTLDGKPPLTDPSFRNCTIVYEGGDLPDINGKLHLFSENQLEVDGDAKKPFALLKQFWQCGQSGRKMVRELLQQEIALDLFSAAPPRQ